jgi:hypothetical protein
MLQVEKLRVKVLGRGLGKWVVPSVERAISPFFVLDGVPWLRELWWGAMLSLCALGTSGVGISHRSTVAPSWTDDVCSLAVVFIFKSCYDKAPQAGCLKQQKFTFHSSGS